VTRSPLCVLLALVTAGSVSACGKRGSPLAPIRIVPGTITNIIARRTGDEIKVTFNVPVNNADNSTPPVVAAIEVFAAAGPPTVTAPTPVTLAHVELSVPTGYVPPPVPPPQPNRPPPPPPITTLSMARFPPFQLFDPTPRAETPRSRSQVLPSTAAEILVDKYRKARVEVRPLPTTAVEGEPIAAAPEPGAAPSAAAVVTDPRPLPGEEASFSLQVPAERAAAAGSPDASVYRVILVGATDKRRRGTPSPVLEFPLAIEVAAPTQPASTYTATTLTLTWTPGAPAQAFRVYSADRSGKEDKRPLNPAPLALPTFTTPVEFGVERCFVIRAAVVRNPASTESAPTPPLCLTAVDTFPPPAPTGLSLLPTDNQVQLQWNAVTAADLEGYLVLRGVDGAAPQPLMTTPVTELTYRDAAPRAGQRHTYVVVAVDKAGNRSAVSNQVDEAR
jgi:hypothetical protein